jgi:hypothetical protein
MYPMHYAPGECSVDEISIEMQGYLAKLSTQIINMGHIIMELSAHGQVNIDPNFCKFIGYFWEGRYYHFRCQGYLESLVINKCYTNASISYWLHRLLYPACQHFKEAMFHLQAVECINPPEMERFLCKTNAFMRTLEKIRQLAKCYPC